jgi:hypothetical protein
LEFGLGPPDGLRFFRPEEVVFGDGGAEDDAGEFGVLLEEPTSGREYFFF